MSNSGKGVNAVSTRESVAGVFQGAHSSVPKITDLTLAGLTSTMLGVAVGFFAGHAWIALVGGRDALHYWCAGALGLVFVPIGPSIVLACPRLKGHCAWGAAAALIVLLLLAGGWTVHRVGDNRRLYALAQTSVFTSENCRKTFEGLFPGHKLPPGLNDATSLVPINIDRRAIVFNTTRGTVVDIRRGTVRWQTTKSDTIYHATVWWHAGQSPGEKRYLVGVSIDAQKGAGWKPSDFFEFKAID